MDKISIIVPCHNTELYISTCLNSLVNQTYSNFEIIVINDGSTDKTKDIVEIYADKYPHIIKLYNFEKNNLSNNVKI